MLTALCLLEMFTFFSWLVISLTGTSFSTAFCAWFLRKILLMLHSINWPIFIIWLSLVLEILDNVCCNYMSSPICDVRNFEINHSFLIKPFSFIIFAFLHAGNFHGLQWCRHIDIQHGGRYLFCYAEIS